MNLAIAHNQAHEDHVAAKAKAEADAAEAEPSPAARLARAIAGSGNRTPQLALNSAELLRRAIGQGL